MNCILFEKNSPFFIEKNTETALHLRKTLKVKSGDEIFAGVVNGEMFMARIEALSDGSYKLEKTRTLGSEKVPQKSENLSIASAIARPQIAKRILFESACFGVENLLFYPAQKSDESYLKSSLYKDGEFRKYLIKGAEQACVSHIPKFRICNTFDEALEILHSHKLNNNNILKLAPDPYEFTHSMGEIVFQKFFGSKNDCEKNPHTVLVLGGERGFSNQERELLREKKFKLVSLGKRILRTDSAFIACLALLSAAK